MIAPEGQGSFLIYARRLVNLLKEIAEQPITISLYEVEVNTQSGHYSMVALLAEQYPAYKREEQ